MANEMKVSNNITQHETSERNCKQSEHTNMVTFYINQTSKDESIKDNATVNLKYTLTMPIVIHSKGIVFLA